MARWRRSVHLPPPPPHHPPWSYLFNCIMTTFFLYFFHYLPQSCGSEFIESGSGSGVSSESGSGSGSGYGSGSKVWMIKTEGKKYRFDQQLQFTYVQSTGEPFSSQKERPALQNMKFLNFFCLLLWVIFALLDPGSTDLIESGSGSETPDISRRRRITTAAAPPAAGSS